MTVNRHPKLAATTFKLYRTHWVLFWCIMLPVAILAIGLDIAQTFRLDRMLEADLSSRPPSYPNGQTAVVVSNISTAYGIHSTVASSTDTTTNPKYPYRTTWQLFPNQSFRVDNKRGTSWEWDLTFHSFYFTRLFLLLLTLCPLSLAVARISRGSENMGNTEDMTPLTTRDMWRQTGRKAFTLFFAFLLFMLIVDIGSTLYGLITMWVPSLNWKLSIVLVFPLMMVLHIYLFVMFSLYNPCLILEDNSIVGIFRRSYALVRGARLRFFGIYFLTGWIAFIIGSVLFGAVLLVFSIFIPDLAPVREALLPLQFLTLFIGFNVQVELPKLLGDPAMVTILIVRDLITTAIIPIWAIVTTHLYLERADEHSNTIAA